MRLELIVRFLLFEELNFRRRPPLQNKTHSKITHYTVKLVVARVVLRLLPTAVTVLQISNGRNQLYSSSPNLSIYRMLA